MSGFRHYLPEGSPPPEPAAAHPPPRPGHGRVWLNGGDESTWFASWQDGPGLLDSPMGTREQAIAAALEMPAADRWIFSAADNDYVELEGWLAPQKRAGSV